MIYIYGALRQRDKRFRWELLSTFLLFSLSLLCNKEYPDKFTHTPYIT
jgi:hypothetical protein